MCTEDCETLIEAMSDAERVESAHRRLKNTAPVRKNTVANEGSAPMEISNMELKKLTPAGEENV